MFNKLIQFLDDNLVIILVVLPFLVVGCIFHLFWRWTKRDIEFPTLESVNVIYREKWVSGHSHQSAITRFGGANNCLIITLTEDELWVTSHFPFTLFLGFCDLEHRIKLNDIIDIQRKGKSFTLDFANPEGELGRITLKLREADEFQEAMRPLLEKTIS